MNKNLKSILKRHLVDRQPDCIVLNSENKFDASTPIGEILYCIGWGRSTKYIAYDVPGWDLVGKEERYLVVKDVKDVYHVVSWDNGDWTNPGNLSDYAIEELSDDLLTWAQEYDELDDDDELWDDDSSRPSTSDVRTSDIEAHVDPPNFVEHPLASDHPGDDQ